VETAPGGLAAHLLDYGRPRFENWRRLPFLAGLASGTLPAAVFRHYLEQDFVYLRHYARLYSRLAAIAPDADVEHFIALASGIVTVELDNHRALGDGFGCDFDRVESSAETLAYTAFLTELSDDMGEALVSMLPCVAGYGIAVRGLSAADAGPYAGWIAAYSGSDYQHVIDRHLALVDHFDVDAARAKEIMDRALDLEDAFWNQLPESQGNPS
jgi:thiaminase